MNKYHLFIILCLTLLASCGSETKPYGTVKLPIIEECEKYLVDRLERDEWKGKIQWSIDKFTDTISTEQYPNLVGVLTINGLTKEFSNDTILKRIINHVILDCYPTTTTEIKMSDMGEEFRNTLSLLRRFEKPKKEYLVIEQDKVILHFRDGKGINK